MSQQRSIITGGCGFIGSHCVDRFLAEGHQVVVIDNFSTGRPENLSHVKDKVEIIEADLADTNPKWMEKIQSGDRIIHLAALADIVPSIQHPDLYYKANVTGTFNLVQRSQQVGVSKFIYAASSSCYGLAEEFPTPETAQIKPEYPYALTKRLGEETVLHWAKVYDLPAISLRFFNVYGPRSRTSGTYGAMFGVFLAQKLNNKAFTVVGDGTQSRDFTYVTDIADAVFTASESHQSGEVFNVGTGKPISVNQVVELLGGEKIFIPKRPGEPEVTQADVSKIKQQLRWEAKVDIQKGVNELLKNIDYWKNAPVWDPESIAKETSDWFKYLSKAKQADG